MSNNRTTVIGKKTTGKEKVVNKALKEWFI
jgi:hypothetical protein